MYIVSYRIQLYCNVM